MRFEREETITLEDERERLSDRLDDLAAKAAEAADSEDRDASGYRAIARKVETHLGGVEWLCAEYDADATVTVHALTAGENARVEDDLADARSSRNQDQLPGATRNFYAAAGLDAAPFLADDADLKQRKQAVGNLPVGTAKWLYSRVDNLSSVEGNGYKSFDARLTERRD